MPPKYRCPDCGMGVVINPHTQKIQRHCTYEGPWCTVSGITMAEALKVLFS